ncbi:glycosyltransferase family 28, putative [Bodo saltans]|uniref:UDP-N-acetylglucosamine transferase subunit ALG14 n=1 Tax=Bodo saltans TaxID=75058 RepID=A0A0S4IKP3_BODSA|nr:glycosyltransferase family 28, putative [Bodo saltans]|eukprot:CUE67548.1 glycosyltransferase family 28, putative [Bodo saltans]
MLVSLLIMAIFASLIFVGRFIQLLLEHPSATIKASRQETLKVCIVLGSGGHTSEMINTLRVLPAQTWKASKTFDVVYVVSATDKDSSAVATRFEKEHGDRDARILRIPRAREVGQSYLTSVWSTLRALYVCLSYMWTEHPDVIITNGPGVCIPVVGASLLIAAVCCHPRPLIAYFESFTCVDHLSMSGTLLLPIADVFTVQWKSLFDIVKAKRFQLKSIAGRLWFTGPIGNHNAAGQDAKDNAKNARDNTRNSGVALITVGSTKFDDLMSQVDTPQFFEAVKRQGITKVLVQKGRSDYTFTTPTFSDPATDAGLVGSYDGVDVEVFPYRPFLQDILRSAQLVISHAGAGTILEALAHGRSMVVVPNEKLMSNHQLQLARSLAEEKFLFLVMVRDLCEALPRLPVDDLIPFPPPNEPAIMETFRRIFRRSF